MSIDRKTFLRRLGGGAAGLLATNVWAGPAVRPPAFDEANPERFWLAVRDCYSILVRPAYLNTGGLGPSPDAVVALYEKTARDLQRRVETGHGLFDEARGVLAEFLGATAEEICFTRNATEGNSVIAAGLALRAGDEVILDAHAHPGGSLPWLNQAKQRGVVVRTFEPDPISLAGNLERIGAQLTPRTRVIQVSHITAPTGIVLPVREIASLARERGLWLHVDGAQSAGQVPVDLTALGCDSYATSGHKWLGGPRETGVLFIRRERNEEIAPMHVGAYSSGDFDFCGNLCYTAGAARHEYGTRNAAAVVALAEAARFQAAIGRSRIAQRGAGLALRVSDGLAGLPGVTVLTPTVPELRASMVAFQVAGFDASRLFGVLLQQHGLRCRPVTEAGLQAVRVSLHLFNTTEECDRVVAAVRGLVRPT